MQYTASDLIPGAAFVAKRQGVCITPQRVNVKVHWVGPQDVHYTKEGYRTIHVTSIARFLETINE